MVKLFSLTFKGSIVEAFVTVSKEKDGFLATFFNDKDLITHDSFYLTEEEMRLGLADYIRSERFEYV